MHPTEADLATHRKAVLLLEAGRDRDALQLLARAPLSDPAAPLFQLVRASAHAKLGEHDEALRAAGDVLAARPGDAFAKLIQAQVHLERGDTRIAEPLILSALAANPTDLTTLYLLASCAHGKGDIDAALRAIDAARLHHPGDARVHGYAAVLHATRDDHAAARAAIREAQRLAPDDADILGFAAEVSERAGRRQRGLELREAGLAKSPDEAAVGTYVERSIEARAGIDLSPIAAAQRLALLFFVPFVSEWIHALLPYVQVRAVVWVAVSAWALYLLWQYGYAAYLHRFVHRYVGLPSFLRVGSGHPHFLLGLGGTWGYIVFGVDLALTWAHFLCIYGIAVILWAAFSEGRTRAWLAVALGLLHALALLNFCLEVWGPGAYHPITVFLVVLPFGLAVLFGLFGPQPSASSDRA